MSYRITHPARYHKRPAKPQVAEVLILTRELIPLVRSLGDYDRTAKWADLNDHFTTWARFAARDLSSLIYDLEMASKEARTD